MGPLTGILIGALGSKLAGGTPEQGMRSAVGDMLKNREARQNQQLSLDQKRKERTLDPKFYKGASQGGGIQRENPYAAGAPPPPGTGAQKPFIFRQNPYARGAVGGGPSPMQPYSPSPVSRPYRF